MADRNILFNGAMVAALLAGRKTQTRRLAMVTAVMGKKVAICSPDESLIELEPGEWKRGEFHYLSTGGLSGTYKTYASVGDRLYVCETHYRLGHWEPKGTARTKGGKQKWHFVEDHPEVLFDPPSEFRRGMHNADPYTPAWHKRLGRFMFKKHSRLTIEVTDVKLERLRDISEEDAVSEGIGKFGRFYGLPDADWDFASTESAVDSYAGLWDSINPDTPWDTNPWVVVYTFVTINANIEHIEAAE